MKNILVTGGLGFIGSHTCVELINEGYVPVVVDNLSNSKELVAERIEKITGTRPKIYIGDIRDEKLLGNVIADENIDAVIHFAGLKAVGESVKEPMKYYENNVGGTITLLRAMRKNNVKNIVFSSSATVYGTPERIPIDEECKGTPTNPYGATKALIERILTDVAVSDGEWNVMILRYFNPIGAHESGLIGEDPNGIPNNLVPYVAKVAIGKLPEVHVFGNDYDTEDGTGVRDYIHVVDLARGHIYALKAMEDLNGVNIVNLGTGCGYSVLDIINAYSKACGKEIPYVIDQRRAGDIAVCYADPTRAEKLLGWKAEYGIEKMCEDSYRWQTLNPDGYES